MDLRAERGDITSVAAGPIWAVTQDRSAVLRSCFTESLHAADGLGARSVAFPAISAGVYGRPVEAALSG